LSARDDTRLALDIISAATALGLAVAEGVRQVIAATRPDIVLAEPPPAGRYAEIVAEDADVLARRFGRMEGDG
jgi:hypothetical protein